MTAPSFAKKLEPRLLKMAKKAGFCGKAATQRVELRGGGPCRT